MKLLYFVSIIYVLLIQAKPVSNEIIKIVLHNRITDLENELLAAESDAKQNIERELVFAREDLYRYKSKN